LILPWIWIVTIGEFSDGAERERESKDKGAGIKNHCFVI